MDNLNELVSYSLSFVVFSVTVVMYTFILMVKLYSNKSKYRRYSDVEIDTIANNDDWTNINRSVSTGVFFKYTPNVSTSQYFHAVSFYTIGTIIALEAEGVLKLNTYGKYYFTNKYIKNILK